MGKKGRPAAKKATQKPKASLTQPSKPSKYGIARFFIRSTPTSKVEGGTGPSQATAVSTQGLLPQQKGQPDGQPVEQPAIKQPETSQKDLGASTMPAGGAVHARPPSLAWTPTKQAVQGACEETPSPMLGETPLVVAPPNEIGLEGNVEQPAKRPRTSGGMSFLSSQNDGEEVVWRTSPLAPLPASAPSGGGPDPRASSAYARGGPAGFSGRCSPLPAVKNMLSTASMLKQCGKTTSPPDAKAMSSMLDQWLQPRAGNSGPSPLPEPGPTEILVPRDAKEHAAPLSPPKLLLAASVEGPPLAERALVALNAAPAVAVRAAPTAQQEGSLEKVPASTKNPFKTQPEAGQLSNWGGAGTCGGRVLRRCTTPSRPKKKVLLELLDRVESAVRQRRQSGSPTDAPSLQSPVTLAMLPRSGPQGALCTPASGSVLLPSRRGSPGSHLETVPEGSESEAVAQQGQERKEAGQLASPGAEGSGRAGGRESMLAALGVSAEELAPLQESLGLADWDWQDEELLQEVRRACQEAEDQGGHTAQATPQTEQHGTGPDGQVAGGPPQLGEADGGEQVDDGELQGRSRLQALGKPSSGGDDGVLTTGGGTASGKSGKDQDVEDRGAGQAGEQGFHPQQRSLDSELLRHHFCVKEVGERCVEVGREVIYEKVLRVVNDYRCDESWVLLRDEWAESSLAVGDRVSVIGDFEVDSSTGDQRCVVAGASGLLIHHPDVLVKGSKVGTSMGCLRRFVLEERLQGSDMGTAALLGTLVHTLFQAAISSGDMSTEGLEEEAWLVVQQHQEKLYAAGETEQSALAHLCESIPAIQQWAHHFLGSPGTRGPATEVDFGVAGKLRTAVTQVLDIEERVWSPRFGLKGMIDVSLRVATSGQGPARSALMPFELKTGKKTTGYSLVEHRAQVILYTLLMADRYQEAITAGLLFYSHTGQSLGIPVQRGELVSLVLHRNKLAAALRAAAQPTPAGCTLPPVLQDSRMCQWCSQLEACAVYQKATAAVPCASDENAVVAGKGAHLESEHAAFFRHWEYLLNKEAQDTQSDLRAVWGRSGQEQQAAGRCLAGLRVVGEPEVAQGGSKEHKLVYHFQPHGYSVLEGPLQEGDYVLLSTEGDNAAVALANGTIVNKEATGVKVSVPCALRLPARGGLSGPERLVASSWRLDRNDNAYHTNLARTNLVNLMAATGDPRRRALIVDKQAPVFDASVLTSQDPALAYCRQLMHINDDQRRALTQVLSARDYCMVLGMPGTGKTSTICHAVRALLARGASVLVTSHTNSAVDNILIKLHHQGVEFVRVGRAGSIHPAVQPHALDSPGNAPGSVAALEARVTAARVVGVTCLGVTHPLFSKRTFDVCIVDEASQITLPACLGPLRCARMFVLVGDHHQLPPLVKSAAAREGGLAVSLFKLLSDAHPEAVAALETQYRMNADIMLLSNTLVYGHRLRCASPAVAEARLALSTDFVGSQGSAWLRSAVDPLRRVVFLDTDSLGGAGQEVRQQDAVHNLAEACLVTKVVSALQEGGISPGDVGVISPYQAQVKLISRLTADLRMAGLEVHTVDKYQGRDKDCIVVSFVRSNLEKSAGHLLTDARRINVALTRAKKKLVLIGSGSTLSSVPLLRAMMGIVMDNRWLVCMPPGLLAQKRLEVPRDDSAALRLAEHLQQSLSQPDKAGGAGQHETAHAAKDGPGLERECSTGGPDQREGGGGRRHGTHPRQGSGKCSKELLQSRRNSGSPSNNFQAIRQQTHRFTRLEIT